MSCEQPKEVYAYISMGLGHSQLIHRRVAHDQKYGFWTLEIMLLSILINVIPLQIAADFKNWTDKSDM